MTKSVVIDSAVALLLFPQAAKNTKNTVKAITRDIEIFLNKTNGLDKNFNKLLNISSLEKLVEVMKDNKIYKPTTRAEKLRRLKLAIKFIIRDSNDQELYYRG